MKKITFYLFILLCLALLAGRAQDGPAAAPDTGSGSAAQLNLTRDGPPAPEDEPPDTVEPAEDCGGDAEPEPETPAEKIPMMMLGGELYCDTGETSDDARCGVTDGQITSSVEPWERPGDDGQSNFGSGFGYQYTRKDGTVEVNVDGQWRVFKLRSELRVRYCDNWYDASDVSDETLRWLLWFNSLDENEQLCVSFTPPDLYELCGYPAAEDISAEDAQE